MAYPAWFNEQQYLESKLAQLQAAGDDSFNTVSLKLAIVAAGYDAFTHFQTYSLVERTSPNEYFNAAEYLLAKAAQANANEVGGRTDWTADSIADAIAAAGIPTIWDHFATYGWAEGVNPSNAFDVSDYFANKLAQLQADEPTVGWSDASMKAAFAASNLDPITHYLSYGAAEGVDVTAVPATESALITLTTLLATLAAAQDAEAAALVAVGLEDADNEIVQGNELGLDEDAADFAAADSYFGEDAADELVAADQAAVIADDAHEDAIADLANARITANDVAVAAALTAAEEKVAGDETAAALLADYEEAVAGLEADVAANGTTLELASALSDAIGAYLAQYADIDDLVNDAALQEIVTAYQAVVLLVEDGLPIDVALAAWAAQVEEAVVAIGADEDDTTGLLVDGTRADAVIAALGEVTDRLALEATVDETLVAYSGNGFGNALLAAQAAQDARDAAIALVDSTAVDLAAAEAYAAELGELVGAYNSAVTATTAAEDAIDEAGFVLQSSTTSTPDLSDVYTVESADADDIEDFAAGDVISVSGFTLNSGDVEVDGNNNVLEYFLTETEAGLVVTFETALFGSNAAVPEVVTITLTGVSLEDVSVSPAYIVGL